MKKESKIEELEFPFLELLQEYRYIPAYFEFQLEKVKDYCFKNDITNDEIQRFIQYIDEDLDKKFTKDRKNELFLSVVIPSIISIVTVYISNNEIKNIGEILVITLLYVFVSLIITSGVYFIFSIRNLIVDKRRNYLELKDVLRNVNMDRVKEEKKIIFSWKREELRNEQKD